MMDIFESKNIKPMLIAELQEPFDSPDYIFELKLDGERCIAYLDKTEGTDLRNKRSVRMITKVPELSQIHKQIKYRCILDGELFVLKNGKPNFFEIQRRSLMTNAFKIQHASMQFPASFVAFDILYYKDHQVTDLPLIERKKLLNSVVKENERIAISRYIEQQGIAFYELAKQQELEGIVAKRKDSKYYMDKRTKDWIKIKNLKDDDFVVCGYIVKGSNKYSLVIAQYQGNNLVYKGHVTSGVTKRHIIELNQLEHLTSSPLLVPTGNEYAVWISPKVVCTVQWMPRINEGLNQSVFKGFRDDKSPEDCTIK